MLHENFITNAKYMDDEAVLGDDYNNNDDYEDDDSDNDARINLFHHHTLVVFSLHLMQSHF